ncbi:hypothetical protein GCM10027185_09100 [Spirosoma pulveris]
MSPQTTQKTDFTSNVHLIYSYLALFHGSLTMLLHKQIRKPFIQFFDITAPFQI